MSDEQDFDGHLSIELTPEDEERMEREWMRRKEEKDETDRR